VNKEEGCSEGLQATRIYEEDVNMKFLVCGVPCTLDACLLGALEEGLNALLNIEIRVSKLEPVLLHLFKLKIFHMELLQCTVISQLAVLHTCHFLFLAVPKLVLISASREPYQ